MGLELGRDREGTDGPGAAQRHAVLVCLVPVRWGVGLRGLVLGCCTCKQLLGLASALPSAVCHLCACFAHLARLLISHAACWLSTVVSTQRCWVLMAQGDPQYLAMGMSSTCGCQQPCAMSRWECSNCIVGVSSVHSLLCSSCAGTSAHRAPCGHVPTCMAVGTLYPSVI